MSESRSWSNTPRFVVDSGQDVVADFAGGMEGILSVSFKHHPDKHLTQCLAYSSFLINKYWLVE